MNHLLVSFSFCFHLSYSVTLFSRLSPVPAAAPGPGSRVLLYLHGGGYVMGSPAWAVYREFATALLLAIDAEIARRRSDGSAGRHKGGSNPAVTSNDGAENSNDSNSNSDSNSNTAGHDASFQPRPSSNSSRLPPNVSRAPLGVLSLDSRLAPEHLFPAAPEDALAAYSCLLAAGVRPEDIAIAGDSAGGNLVLSLALAIDRVGAPAPGAVVAFSPWGDLSCAGHSHGELADDDPVLPTAAIKTAANALVGRVAFPTVADAAVAVVGTGVVAVAEKARAAEVAVGNALPAPLGAAAAAVVHAVNDAVFADIEAAAKADAAEQSATKDEEDDAITRVLRHPVASPSWATGAELARLPSTLILSGAREVLLSDSITPFETLRAYVDAAVPPSTSNSAAAAADTGAAGAAGAGRPAEAAAGGGPAAAAAAAGKASGIKAEAKEREEEGEVTTQAKAAEGTPNHPARGQTTPAHASAAAATGAGASAGGAVKTPKPRMSLKASVTPAPSAASSPTQTPAEPAAQGRRLRMTPADLAAMQTATGGHEEPVVAPVELAVDVPPSARGPNARRGSRWELSVWPGMFHVFPLAPFLPESQAAVRRVASFLVETCKWDLPREADLKK